MTQFIRDTVFCAKQIIIICAVPVLSQSMLNRFACWLIPDDMV